jgi:hypothetical protein
MKQRGPWDHEFTMLLYDYDDQLDALHDESPICYHLIDDGEVIPGQKQHGLPHGYRAINLKSIYKVKKHATDVVIKYKARLIKKEYVQ